MDKNIFKAAGVAFVASTMLAACAYGAEPTQSLTNPSPVSAEELVELEIDAEDNI